jgi:hypothetical protein
MCWNTGASLALSVAGAGTAYYTYKRGDSAYTYIPIAYFALMELLQALTYPVIGQCSSVLNQDLTALSYLHITLQPLVLNMWYLGFLSERSRKRVFYPVVLVSVLAMLLMWVRLIPFSWTQPCWLGGTLCGRSFCALPGVWHLAWYVPLTTFMQRIPIYWMAVFIPPFFFGAWRPALFLLVTGPLLVSYTTSNPSEAAAIWCLFSIPQLAVTLYKPFHSFLRARQ